MKPPPAFSIALVHQAALGDTVLLVPLLRALRLRFPGCAITLVSRPAFGRLLAGMAVIDTFASADDREHTLWFAPPSPPEPTAGPGARSRPNSVPRWAGADLLLCAVAGETDAWAANARLARGDRDAGSVRFFYPRPPGDFRGHVTGWHRGQLGALKLPEPPLPPARINPQGEVLIHPGSGNEGKCWPLVRFLGLARRLKGHGLVPRFLLGEAERERGCMVVIKALGEEFPYCDDLELDELARRISCAKLYVGNDAGVTHLAAALGVPTVTLFGPTDDVQWRPVGPRVRVVRGPERSLEGLSEEKVWEEVKAELNQAGG
jgi:heptosyltransferase III